jgi:hypothetical protein
MHDDFATIDVSALATITGGEGESNQGPNQERAQVGLQVKGVNLGVTAERTRTDYKTCLDQLQPGQSARAECGLPGGGQ